MKFSIRDLMFVTVIVALALGWWLDHRRLIEDGWWFRDTQRLEFEVAVMEEVLRERGVTVTFPDDHLVILTENGKMREIHVADP